jgi:hypothetical protein
MPKPVADSPVTRGFQAVRKVAALTGSGTLTLLYMGQSVEDDTHRSDVLVEIGRHLASLTSRDDSANDLARFVPILEIVPVGVVIQTAMEDTPAPRFYGGY